MKERFERLIHLIEQSKELKNFSLEDILKEAVNFFEELRVEFPKASQDEKDAMLKMMNTLHSKIQEISKITAEKSGMTEEELFAFGENPSNFSPEQWRLVQESKSKLYESARKLSSSIRSPQVPQDQSKPHKPISKKVPRPPKDKWLKS